MLTTARGKGLRDVINGGARKPEVYQTKKELAGRKKEYSRERQEEDINICLTCEKTKCTGYCKRIEASRREIARERRGGRTT